LNRQQERQQVLLLLLGQTLQQALGHQRNRGGLHADDLTFRQFHILAGDLAEDDFPVIIAE